MKAIVDVTRKHYDQVRFILILSLVVVSLMTCSTTVSAATPGAGNDEKYTCPGAFSIVVPRDWEKVEKGHPYGDLTKITGIRLIGPINSDGVRPTLSALYYSGEGAFRTPDSFIRNKFNSLVRTDFDRESIVSDIQIVGRPGKKFYIKTFELVYLPTIGASPNFEDPRRIYRLVPPHKEVDMVEHYIVIPGGQGYYVLGYRSPAKLEADNQALFDTIVNSFHPLQP